MVDEVIDRNKAIERLNAFVPASPEEDVAKAILIFLLNKPLSEIGQKIIDHIKKNKDRFLQLVIDCQHGEPYAECKYTAMEELGIKDEPGEYLGYLIQDIVDAD
jgi:hypothetical protein